MSLTTVDQGLLGTYAQYTGFKNRIINGDMSIDQRYAGSSFSGSNGAYTVDRWKTYQTTGQYSIQQVSDAPAGFSKSIKCTVTTPQASLGAGDYYSINQSIEGLNISDFAWGTASATPVAVSFWVKSSLTGTFSWTIQSPTFTTYVGTFSISSANTWQKITTNIAGPTTGSWPVDNSTGIFFAIGLGNGSTYTTATVNQWTSGNYFAASGQVNFISTNGATFYITGVQLEKGSTATSFDYRPYGTELALCQRYYEKVAGSQNSMLVGGYGGSELNFYFSFLVSKRASPTMAEVGTWVTSNISVRGFTGQDTRGFSYYMVPSSSARTYIYNSNSGAEWTASSEL